MKQYRVIHLPPFLGDSIKVCLRVHQGPAQVVYRWQEPQRFLRCQLSFQTTVRPSVFPIIPPT